MSLELLWIEEEPESVSWEQRLASALGFTVTCVPTTEAAKRELASKCYDLIILDLILPIGDEHQRIKLVNAEAGMELLRHIRDTAREEKTPTTVRVLVFSAVVSPERKLQVVKLLKSDRFYLSKPVAEDAYRGLLTEIRSEIQVTRD